MMYLLKDSLSYTEDQKIFIEVNAELAEIWPVQTEVTAPMDDAEKWNGVSDKLAMLEK